MKSPKVNGIGEVVTEYGARVMKVIKKGLLGRSLFDFYGDIKAQAFRTKELDSVPTTPSDKKGGIIYTKSADGKLYYKSNEISEVELSSQGTNTTYSVSCVDGDNSDEEKIRLTGSDSSTDDVVLEAGTGLSIARDGDKITFTNTVTDTDTVLTTEQVQDIAGALIATGGTKTNIAVTYDDTNNNMDFVVASDLDTTGQAGTAVALTTGDKAITGTLTVTDSAENIVLNSTEADGNPLLTFKQDSTRRAFIQLADNFPTGDTNHLRIASEYGPVSIAVASTSGSDTDTVYLKVNPEGIFTFGAPDLDAVLTTDGSMTFRIDADNDETSQKFAFQNNASTEIANLDESGNLQIDGGLTTGSTSAMNSSGVIQVAAQPNITTLAGFVTGSANQLITDDGDGTVTSESGLTYDSSTDTLQLTSTSNGFPRVEIKSNANTNFGQRLTFIKDRGAAPSDGDTLGIVRFEGEDSGQNATFYAQISGAIAETTDGQEGGKLLFQIASHDGEAVTGLEVVDGNAEDEVDVNIGSGTSSITTIAGELQVTGNFIGNRKIAISSGTDGNVNGGDIVYFGGTTSMTIGRIYHYKSDGTWEIANADAVATSDGLLGVALGSASDTHGVLLRGMVTLDHDPGAVGDVLYVQSDNAGTTGHATATAPSASGDCVRVVGYCVHASAGNVWFNPDSTFVEVA